MSPKGKMRPGLVLAERTKNGVRWLARVGFDRGRLEVLALVPPSDTVTAVEPLTSDELLELLGEPSALDAREHERL